MFPVLGWLDDTFLVGLLAYYLRYRRLPGYHENNSHVFPNSGRTADHGGGQSRSGHADRGKKETDRNAQAPRDPYEILGVSPDSDPCGNRAAYRDAAQQYHPDKVAHLERNSKNWPRKSLLKSRRAYNELSQKHT
ncbi:MAG: J domain-containing protein [Desulfobacterales bacterium]